MQEPISGTEIKQTIGAGSRNWTTGNRFSASTGSRLPYLWENYCLVWGNEFILSYSVIHLHRRNYHVNDQVNFVLDCVPAPSDRRWVLTVSLFFAMLFISSYQDNVRAV